MDLLLFSLAFLMVTNNIHVFKLCAVLSFQTCLIYLFKIRARTIAPDFILKLQKKITHRKPTCRLKY